MNKTHSSGFTLIEVMIVIAILSIFAGIAIPSFSTLIANNRMAGQANDFLSTLQFARSEAITRGRRISICPSTSGSACTSSAWNGGWMVFAESLTGTVGTFDATTDTILRVYPPMQGTSSLVEIANAAVVTYQPNGSVMAARTFTLCPNDGSDVEGRSIPISSSGRAHVQTTAACP